MNKKYIVEALGTFVLTFSVLATMLGGGGALLPTPIIAAFTLMVLVFMLGSVSGGHFNPAVSIGAWSVGKLPAADLPFYVMAQAAGAILAKIAILSIGSIDFPVVAGGENATFLMAEAVGAGLFTMGIAGVLFYKNTLSSSTAPFMIGLSLLLGLGIAGSLGSAGVLNPAVALGLNITTWPYLVGPVLGSLIGFRLYSLLK